MAYAKRYGAGFVDKPTLTTPIDSQFLNAVEAALLALFDANPGSAGMVPVWTPAGTHYVPQLLTNASIDPAAAIAKSKLAALNILDADVAGGAAIARSKLNFGAGLVDADIATAAAIANSKLGIPLFTVSSLGGGPPGSPNDKDIWIATNIDGGSRMRWAFQYNSGATTYKWEFIGGTPIRIFPGGTYQNTLDSTWQYIAGLPSFTLARAGRYRYRFGAQFSGNNANFIYLTVGNTSAGNLSGQYIQLGVGSSLGANIYFQQMMENDDLSGGLTRSAGEVVALVMQSTAHANVSWTSPFMSIEPIHII